MSSAREYLRVSADKSGRGASVTQQHDDNRRAADAAGWELLAPYREPEAVSASRYSVRAREAFTTLLDDIERGAFGASVLMLWEASRGSRRTGEWVDLIDVCAAAGVSIFVTTHSRTYDPGNSRDRRTLLEDAIDSEYESAKLSDRVTRAMAANAQSGRPHGQIPYGFRRVYDDRSGSLIRQEPDPATAPHIAELFERVRAGESLRSIERDWAGREIVNKSGRPFGSAHLRSLMNIRAYVGDREHNGTVYPDAWEPIVNRETWQAVRSILSNPSRRTSRPGRGKYQVSMIARCAVCTGPMVGSPTVDGRKRNLPTYRCQSNHVVVGLAALDEHVMQIVGAYLCRPDVRAALTAASVNNAEVQVARDLFAKIREQLSDLYARGSDGTISPAGVAEMEPGIVKRLESARGILDGLQTPSALSGIFGADESPAAVLRGLTTERLRAVYGLICTPDLLGVPHVCRSARKGPNQPPTEERIEWKRTGA